MADRLIPQGYGLCLRVAVLGLNVLTDTLGKLLPQDYLTYVVSCESMVRARCY